jgi:glutamine synthetase
MAGILHSARIREITAFLNPLKSSYDRFGSFEAPLYVSWSSLNRSQLIRLPAAEKARRRMELRSPDPSCNQYAALALIISAGFEGINEKRLLPPALDMNMFKAKPADIRGVEMLPLKLLPKLLSSQKQAAL